MKRSKRIILFFFNEYKKWFIFGKKKSMSKYGKWIGGGLGWAFGGPIGAIFGFFIGSVVDGMNSGVYEVQRTQGGDFTASLIVLTAAIMKADGKIMKSELDYVKQFFIQNFGVADAKNKLNILKEIINKDIDLEAVCKQIKTYMDPSSRLQLIHFLFGIAQADGSIDTREEMLINRIGLLLGISANEYNSIKYMFVADTDKYYKILEIEKTATNEEIKKAYRKLANRYHPDKVSHLGEQYQKDAHKKFQQLNEAYNAIKKERAIN